MSRYRLNHRSILFPERLIEEFGVPASCNWIDQIAYSENSLLLTTPVDRLGENDVE